MEILTAFENAEKNYLEASMKMKQDGSVPSPMVLTQDIVRFGGMQLLYSLRVMEGFPSNRFEISITKDDETMSARAGDQLDDALECYHRVVQGIVTPCTLEDVIKDFEYSRIKLKKNLYKRSIM